MNLKKLNVVKTGSDRLEGKKHMKIIIETSLKKIPSCCRKCKYYLPGEWIAGIQENDGMCSALTTKDHYTNGIAVSRERLKNCPLKVDAYIGEWK